MYAIHNFGASCEIFVFWQVQTFQTIVLLAAIQCGSHSATCIMLCCAQNVAPLCPSDMIYGVRLPMLHYTDLCAVKAGPCAGVSSGHSGGAVFGGQPVLAHVAPALLGTTCVVPGLMHCRSFLASSCAFTCKHTNQSNRFSDLSTYTKFAT